MIFFFNIYILSNEFFIVRWRFKCRSVEDVGEDDGNGTFPAVTKSERLALEMRLEFDSLTSFSRR